MLTISDPNRRLSRNPRNWPEALKQAIADCCCDGSGSGSGGGIAYTCLEAGACFAESGAAAVYSTVDGGGCSGVYEHGANSVDPDPLEWAWLTTTDLRVQGFAGYYIFGDGTNISQECGVGSSFTYSWLCVDRLINSVLVSSLNLVAFYTDGVSDSYYLCESFETISCNPLLIDTGYMSPAEGSGPQMRVILSE